MANDAPDPRVDIASLRAGSVIAAAGCGKTEQIALAVKGEAGCRLILTHTHAGEAALRDRLKYHKVPSERFALNTIAGWSLRFAASYPVRSGLTISEPKTDADWKAVYAAAAQLIESRAIDRVLAASYTGIYVDEYQDCGSGQHRVIAALAKHLPTCVFGDHLQAIFDFKGQAPVDWEHEVFPAFPLKLTLTKPWRWVKAENQPMADWLERVRAALEAGQAIDFATAPSSCVTWAWLPTNDGPRRGAILKACKEKLGLTGTTVIIADPAAEAARASLAKALGQHGYSNIEPVRCDALLAAARKLVAVDGRKHLDAVLDFIAKCMSGADQAPFKKAIASRKAGGKLGARAFGDLVDLAIALETHGRDRDVLSLIEGFRRRPTAVVFRQEMLRSMEAALRIRIADSVPLADALWQVQNKISHAGRRIPRRAVGSTLLIKGLEFEHAVVVHSASMNRKDWYVALTRATKTLTVLSPAKSFTPPA
jgi:hypothetical protein